MKKTLKIVASALVALVFVVSAVVVHHFREQGIAIRMIPNEFNYCGKQIYGNNRHYKEIVVWLKENQSGWKITYATYVPGMVYKHPAFNVNVLSELVIVNYKTDEGYPQFVKAISHKLPLECE